MLKDISDWELVGYGGKSTLEKEELRSPDRIDYLIKYPRQTEEAISWEDITELVAAEIGKIFGLEMMKVEIVTRKGKRGCLLLNFVKQYNALMAEEGGSLLQSLVEGYEELLETELDGHELIDFGFNVMKKFPYFQAMKQEFFDLQIFDILIGNQDRHPYNWTLLFLSSGVVFSPVYDNGASLGFRFDDNKLREMLSNEQAINRYVNKTRVKAGMFEKKKVKAQELLAYINENFPEEFNVSTNKLIQLDLEKFNYWVSQSGNFLSEAQKEWLLHIIPFRRNKILQWIGKEEELHE